MEEYTVKVYDYGTKNVWYNKEGEIHRNYDLPAIEFPHVNKHKEWYRNGKRHRWSGPAVEHADGAKYWYQHGELHRTDGPAIEDSDGTTYWYKNDKLHRLDGPAIQFSHGGGEYWVDGVSIPECVFLKNLASVAEFSKKEMAQRLGSSTQGL